MEQNRGDGRGWGGEENVFEISSTLLHSPPPPKKTQIGQNMHNPTHTHTHTHTHTQNDDEESLCMEKGDDMLANTTSQLL